MPNITVCLSFDVDAVSSWIGTAKSNDPSTVSRGEFSVVGTPRVVNLLKRLDIQATFCIPGHTAYAFPDLVRMIRDEGHEIGHHGWVHENPADFDKAGEIRILEKGLEALERVAGVRPVGYRSPAVNLSHDTLKLLTQYGFEWDSNCFANDFYPYYPRTGDKWGLDEPYQFGEVLDLVEMPVSHVLGDFSAFETIPGFFPGYVPPRTLEGMWKDDFDFAVNECPDGVFILTMHPQTIGRGSRIRMLERFIQYARENADVTFTTMGGYARSWRAANPLEEWKQKNPMRTGVHAITKV
ncbi:polysaccharide deacetylase [Caballeronia hypogeia]|uniref:Polysaccharide deacetylase n=1 Tax=Caballeronia hypogeia TaxID=1777140 RepID=A0A158CIZ2_9BURK|nr:polysaccharide deacetylase [Caballeronia hypogeia]SAK82338.1 polysaccharide deacetylase [Caballeronia hypogeia]